MKKQIVGSRDYRYCLVIEGFDRSNQHLEDRYSQKLRKYRYIENFYSFENVMNRLYYAEEKIQNFIKRTRDIRHFHYHHSFDERLTIEYCLIGGCYIWIIDKYELNVLAETDYLPSHDKYFEY